jgi:hypothetical protein
MNRIGDENNILLELDDSNKTIINLHGMQIYANLEKLKKLHNFSLICKYLS